MDNITPSQQQLQQRSDELPRESPSVQLTPTATLSNEMIQSLPEETITNVPSLPQQDQNAFTFRNITKKPMFYFRSVIQQSHKSSRQYTFNLA